MSEKDLTSPVVTVWAPTPDCKGRCYTLEPGKRVVLNSQYDSWEPEPGADFFDCLHRVSLSAKEQARREEGARHLEEQLGKVPFYAEQAKHDPDYWRNFYASRINS